MHLALIRDPRVGDRELAIYCALVAHAEVDTGESGPSLKTLGGYFGRGPDTARRAIDVLQELGYVAVEEHPGEASTYRLLPVPTPSTGATPTEGDPWHQREGSPSTGARGPLAPARPEQEGEKLEEHLTPLSAPPTAGALFTDDPGGTENLPLVHAREVFEAWRASTGRNGRVVLDDKRRRLIQKALADYPLDDVLDAVRGWEHSAFHRGCNDRGRPYNDLGLLLRSPEHIERFRDLARGPREPDPTGRARNQVTTDRSIRTGRIEAP